MQERYLLSSFSTRLQIQPLQWSVMAARAFGFSAGDFVSAIKLIKHAGKALKDAGGAAEDYRNFKKGLSSLHTGLTQLQLSPLHESSPFALSTKEQIKVTLVSISEFLTLIAKFDAKLGREAPTEWYQGAGRKVQWAVIYAKRVEELRAKVGLHLQSLILMLQAFHITSQTQEAADNTFVLLTAQVAEILKAEHDSKTQIRQLNTLLEGHVEDVSTCFRAQGDRIENILESLVENNDLQRRQLQSARSRQLLPMNVQSSDVVLAKAEHDDISTLLLRLLSVIIRDLKTLFMSMWLYMPHFMTSLKLLATSLRREPMLLISDSINFEDALGRRYALQYEFYRHWPAFESFLRRNFKQTPGESYVKSGQFLIIDSRTDHLVFSQASWEVVTAPGCELSMSIRMRSFQIGSGHHCPRPNCDGRVSKSELKQAATCPKCFSQYFPLEQHHSAVKQKFLSPLKPYPSSTLSELEDNMNRHSEEMTVFRRVHVYRDSSSRVFQPPKISRSGHMIVTAVRILCENSEKEPWQLPIRLLRVWPCRKHQYRHK
ncbi:hypothetical protein QBC42DRAFT_12890 [Cladorrhinum samala]|uniref:Ubiquitin-like domain-containing protein n=1 Tax=Cladorrhinum samala TaxID=585594 RepID=A0AAV9HX54_9PEZI|nr:hypothetical protein QBC42DRAFT_12890 [Cladorrhinum samala]